MGVGSSLTPEKESTASRAGLAVDCQPKEPADVTTLPQPTDDREDALRASLRASALTPPLGAPGAQLALLGEPGEQLGLDGRAEAAAPPEARSAEPLLGPQHGVSQSLPPDPWGPVQLALDLGDQEAIPQLGLWERHGVAHAAHARVGELPGARGFESRACKCHRTRRVRGNVRGRRSDRGAWSWEGLVTCDLMTCPLCGARRARTSSATLGAVIDRHMKAHRSADAWMLTTTIPHTRHDLVGVTVERLYRAWSHFTRLPEWQRFRDRHGIEAVVRVLDATFGGDDGAHPHFHVLLLPTVAVDLDLEGIEDGWIPTPQSWRNFPQAQREQRLDEVALCLWGAWDRACERAGITRSRGAHALKLSPAEHARAYFLGWGLADEVGAVTSKLKSHVRLLDAAAAGHQNAAAAYTEWCAAVDGRQWVTGLADAAARYGVDDGVVELWLAELRAQRDEAARLDGNPVQLVRALDVEIPGHLYPTALKLGWARIHEILDDADAKGIPLQAALVRELLDKLHTRRAHGPPTSGAPPGG